MPDTMMETATRAPDVLQGAILRTTDTSPFGRKVRIALAMAGWTDVVRCVPSSPVDPADPLRIDNPLGKMPCLVLSDGRTIFDSPVILEFLDGFCGGRFIPSSFDVRIASLRQQALADGLTDAAMLMGSERMFHEAGQVSERWLAHQRSKVERALQAFSDAPPALDIPAIGAISLAASLGYLDWRKPVDWRVAFPRLVEWLEAFGRCVPAYEATRAGY
jgi:glutathione S-transferase